ncbi:MAG: OmpA family protein [Novosphingobium sp.]
MNNHKVSRFLAILVSCLGALVLVACDGGTLAEKAMPDPPASPGSSAEPPAQTSIMRPDIERPRPSAEPLEPLIMTVPFADAGYRLGDDALAVLNNVMASEQIARGGPIVLRGHTDSVGADRLNLDTSRKRAEVVERWLVGKGVAKDRISIVALGEMRPVAPNAHLDGTPDEEGRARNRRVEIVIPAEAADVPATERISQS